MAPAAESTSVPASVAELIDCWKTIAEFVKDVGCGYEAGRKMRDRGSIAPSYWPAVIEAAKNKDVPGIDWEWLGRIHSSLKA